jgi:hypothetical protein
MPYNYDLFISYAHLDDLSPFGDERGWIDLLHERLSVLVSQALGSELRIWRDGHNLGGNDPLNEAIAAGITESLVLVPVISPRYVQSDWCNREMNAFHAAAPPPSAQKLGFRSRVFKVVKTPLPDHLKKLEPEQIKNLIGYQFFGEDESDGKLREFSSDPQDKSYWKTLNRLVSDLKETLIDLKYSADPKPDGAGSSATIPASVETSVATAGRSDPDNPAKLIYLAETTSDLTKERELVRDELRQRGHTVMPNQKLPLEEVKQTISSVQSDLARCALSVHLVGRRYGSTPEDDARSIVKLQEELSAERSQNDPAFRRLLWIPPGLGTGALEISDDRQKTFIADLQTKVMPGAELLQTSIEDLKTRIMEKLNPEAGAFKPKPRHSSLTQVYLICEHLDRASVRPLKEYLFKLKFEVITWLDQGSDKLMEYHHKNLRDCDAALIYFGNGDEPWVRKNLEDLEKAYGYGRETDWLANAVYVAGPSNEQKEDFFTNMVPYVIRNFQTFDPNDLREFVGAMQQGTGGN